MTKILLSILLVSLAQATEFPAPLLHGKVAMDYFYSLPEGKKLGLADYQALLDRAKTMLQADPIETTMGYTLASDETYGCIRVNSIVVGRGEEALKKLKRLEQLFGFHLELVDASTGDRWAGVKSVYSCQIAMAL